MLQNVYYYTIYYYIIIIFNFLSQTSITTNVTLQKNSVKQ